MIGRLGTAYCLGVGVDQNFHEGKKWLERAALAGDYLALYNLGCMYFQGDGVPVDIARAKRLWQKAKTLGSAEATLALAQMARCPPDFACTCRMSCCFIHVCTCVKLM